MSYDLMVFEKAAAPKNRKDFLEWYHKQTEWSEEHDYNNPTETSDNLRSFFMELIKKYPPMNGPFALNDDEIAKMKNEAYLTDYSIGRVVIYAAFAQSVSAQAYKAVRQLARKHDVGLFTASYIDDGKIIFSDKEIISTKEK
ncbi:MAG: hypothetical protein FWG66_14710 [Spirochaetes bacterium]|nr:hypothetical protein [Spirochaetota bacterium]